MGSSEVSKENIVTATIEELSEEERKAYLLLEEHVKAQFLKGFKKDCGGCQTWGSGTTYRHRMF